MPWLLFPPIECVEIDPVDDNEIACSFIPRPHFDLLVPDDHVGLDETELGVVEVSRFASAGVHVSDEVWPNGRPDAARQIGSAILGWRVRLGRL
jgi:hypothetical protein